MNGWTTKVWVIFLLTAICLSKPLAQCADFERYMIFNIDRKNYAYTYHLKVKSGQTKDTTKLRGKVKLLGINPDKKHPFARFAFTDDQKTQVVLRDSDFLKIIDNKSGSVTTSYIDDDIRKQLTKNRLDEKVFVLHPLAQSPSLRKGICRYIKSQKFDLEDLGFEKNSRHFRVRLHYINEQGNSIIQEDLFVFDSATLLLEKFTSTRTEGLRILYDAEMTLDWKYEPFHSHLSSRANQKGFMYQIEPVSDISWKNIEGKTMKISELKGFDYLVIYHWHNSCQPGWALFEKFNSHASDLKKQNIAFIALNTMDHEVAAYQQSLSIIQTYRHPQILFGFADKKYTPLDTRDCPVYYLYDKELNYIKTGHGATRMKAFLKNVEK